MAGHCVVIASPDGRSQRLLPGSAGAEAVTALAVSANKRLLAVAERGGEQRGATATVYDLQTLRRRKVLAAPEAGAAREFVSLSFSPDGKQLLALGGAPDWALVLFAWERAKSVLCSVRATNAAGAALVKCSLCPGADGGGGGNGGGGALAVVLGPGALRLFRVAPDGSALKPLPLGGGARREQLPFTCQAWLPSSGGGGGGGSGAAAAGGGGDASDKAAGGGAADNAAGGGADSAGGGPQQPQSQSQQRQQQLLGTADGEVLLLEGGELRATFDCGAGGRGVESIVAWSKVRGDLDVCVRGGGGLSSACPQ